MSKTRLSDLYSSLQEQLLAELKTTSRSVSHASAQGDATEVRWRELFSRYLPNRYQVSKAFIIDASGARSQEIDVVIHDRQYSPLLLNEGGALYIPAESVYAVFEVRPAISGPNISYAAEKAASVRRRSRTSIQIVHAGGTFEPRPPLPILAGLLCTRSAWRTPLDQALPKRLKMLSGHERLDIGCSLSAGSFDARYLDDGRVQVEISRRGLSLAFFFVRLLSRLQVLGTVSAMDYEVYAAPMRQTIAIV